MVGTLKENSIRNNWNNLLFNVQPQEHEDQGRYKAIFKDMEGYTKHTQMAYCHQSVGRKETTNDITGCSNTSVTSLVVPMSPSPHQQANAADGNQLQERERDGISMDKAILKLIHSSHSDPRGSTTADLVSAGVSRNLTQVDTEN